MAALLRRREPADQPGFTWKATSEGFAFRAVTEVSGRREAVLFPLALGHVRGQQIPEGPFREKCLLLDELVLDNRARLQDEECVLPYPEYYGLDASSRRTLELPPEADFSCAVRTRGIAADRGFQIIVEVTHRKAGRLEGFVPRFESAYLLSENEVLIAPKALYELLHTVDRGVPGDISDPIRARMTYQERVKRKAQAAGVSIEGFMAAESYVLPEDVRLGVAIEKLTDDHLRLKPEIAASEDPAAVDQINRALAQLSGAGPVISVARPDGRRVRAIFDNQEVTAVRELNAHAEIRGADVPRFLDNPDAFVPEGIDLSDFSDRVTGIGIERVAVSPSLRILRRDGGVLEFQTKLNVQPVGFSGGAGFEAREQITAADLPELVLAARAANQDYVYFKGKWVHVDVVSLDAFQKAAAQAEKRYANRLLQKEHLKGFLEIFTNIELLEYGESLQLIREILREQEEAGPRYPVPGLLRGDLLPHQQRGYAWLRFLEEQRWGGLLADDMGLGKTVQAISLLAAMKERETVSPTLIVCPNNVLRNWERELRRFCPALVLYVHHGPDRIRGGDGLGQVAGCVDVVLTTYETMRRDQIALGPIDWAAVVLDEAQNIKNPNTGASTASKAFKSQRTRIALTGTPVENGLSELWSIFDFVQPGHLDSYREFRERYERPIQQEDQERAEGAAADLRSRIAELYLRRLKEEELPGLPARTELVQHVAFGDEQLRIYADLLERARTAGRGKVLGHLQGLVQACSHPLLVKQEATRPPAEEIIAACPKLTWTFEQLEAIRARKERALIFTEYKAMQELLIEAIYRRFGIWAGRINGDVLTHERQRIVDELNDSSEFGVLVMSPTAGGVGLNITGANHVIHYTRLWNPAKEAQATGRVHRIGQQRDVQVYYPIVAHPDFDTIEVRIHELLATKAQLARDIITPSAGLQITQAELEDLLGIKPEGS